MVSEFDPKAPMVTRLLRWCAALAVLSMLTPGALQAAELNEDQKQMAKEGTAHLKRFLAYSQAEAMRNLLGAVRGVVVVPSGNKGGFVFGYEQGNGLLFARHGDKWSDPVAMRLSNFSIGMQAGFKSSSMVIFIMTNKALDELIAGVEHYGGSGGFAAGKWGVSSTGAGGPVSGLQVLIVSTAKGAFLGGGLEKVTIELSTEMNKSVYGDDFDIRKVLSNTESRIPEIEEMRKILTDAVHASWWGELKARSK